MLPDALTGKETLLTHDAQTVKIGFVSSGDHCLLAKYNRVTECRLKDIKARNALDETSALSIVGARVQLLLHIFDPARVREAGPDQGDATLPNCSAVA
jgi:hypothetical protein